MSWETVTLADIKPEEFSQVPLGDYTFTLQPGAKIRVNNFGNEEIVAMAAIAEGDQKGRCVFLQYPDPEVVNTNTGKKQTWSAQALKKLEIALGTDALPGEKSVDYLNRVAGNGHSRFKGTIAPANKIRNGEVEPRNEFKLFSVAPAA
jgi:hypothetical protein